VKPAVNQISTHPRFQRDSLVKFYQKHGICVTAHAPLGGAAANNECFGTVSCLDDPVLKVSQLLPLLMDKLSSDIITSEHKICLITLFLSLMVSRFKTTNIKNSKLLSHLSHIRTLFQTKNTI